MENDGIYLKISTIDENYLNSMANHWVVMGITETKLEFMIQMSEHKNKHALRYVGNYFRYNLKYNNVRKHKLTNYEQEKIYQQMMKNYIAAIDMKDELSMYNLGKYYQNNIKYIHYKIHHSCTGNPKCQYCTNCMITSYKKSGQNGCDEAIIKLLKYSIVTKNYKEMIECLNIGLQNNNIEDVDDIVDIVLNNLKDTMVFKYILQNSKNNPVLLYILGKHYENKEKKLSLGYYMASADKNCGYAMYELGLYYKKNRNKMDMLRWIKQSAKLNNYDSLVFMIKYYKKNANIKKLIEYFNKIIKRYDSPEFINDIIIHYLSNNDMDNAIVYINMAVNKGDYITITNMGILCQESTIINKALEYYHLSVLFGHTRAMRKLAKIYMSIDENTVAIEIYKMATKHKDKKSISKLIEYYTATNNKKELEKYQYIYKTVLNQEDMANDVITYLDNLFDFAT